MRRFGDLIAVIIAILIFVKIFLIYVEIYMKFAKEEVPIVKKPSNKILTYD